ncbi:MAG: hypothetical protein MI784_09510 [Cytophagales bacterium]|nr:hypothetical protein [Cytophagales bacterium]
MIHSILHSVSRRLLQILGGFYLLVFLFFSCENPATDDYTGEGKVALSFLPPASSSSSRVLNSLSLDDVVYVQVRILRQGLLALDAKLPVIHTGGELYINPIALPVGEYRLKQLLLLDASEDILYLAPLENSPMASLVNAPLPVDFSVNANSTTPLAVEILPYDGGPLEDYGYVTLDFAPRDYVKFELLVLNPDSIPGFSYKVQVLDSASSVLLLADNQTETHQRFYLSDTLFGQQIRIEVQVDTFPTQLIYENLVDSLSEVDHPFTVIFGHLSTYYGDITFTSQEQLDSFGSQGYTHVVGDLVFKDNISSFLPLKTLEYLDGSFKVIMEDGHNMTFTDFEGLNNLRVITGHLGFFNSSNENYYASAKGLNNLQRIEGKFGFYSRFYITVDGAVLKKLKHIGAIVDFTGLGVGEGAFKNLEYINGFLLTVESPAYFCPFRKAMINHEPLYIKTNMFNPKVPSLTYEQIMAYDCD